jgi:hypothetical protein
MSDCVCGQVAIRGPATALDLDAYAPSCASSDWEDYVSRTDSSVDGCASALRRSPVNYLGLGAWLVVARPRRY